MMTRVAPRSARFLPLIIACTSAAALLFATLEPAGASPPAGGGSPTSDRILQGEPDIPTSVQEVSKIPVLLVDPTRPLGSTSSDTRLKSGLPEMLDAIKGPARIVLKAGHHDLSPSTHVETCRGCEDPSRPVSATRGLRIRGNRIVIEGAAPESVFIHTGAGYGILFDECEECALRGVTVTGGERDEDPRATDAAIVVSGGSVLIERCHASNNVGDSAAIATVRGGIGGIVARDGARLTMSGCRIVGNSWDGIALWNVGVAEIRDNVVDGVDAPGDAVIGGGHGFGIRVVGEADATIEGNLVARYDNGIGVFGGVKAKVRQNIIEDVAVWGIAAAAGPAEMPGGARGASSSPNALRAEFRRNAVYGSGGCGAVILNPAVSLEAAQAGGARPGRERDGGSCLFSGNAFAMTGRHRMLAGGAPFECLDAAGGATRLPKGVDVRDNVRLAAEAAAGEGAVVNAAPDERARGEMEFRREAKSLVGRLEKWAALREARFVRDFRAR